MRVSVYLLRLRRPTASLLTLVGATVMLPLACSLVTYTFVSLPDNSISLNQSGSLVALLVLLKIFILGATGRLPIDLNEFFSKRRGKRGARYLVEEALEDDLPCTIRILCELETAARGAMDDLMPDPGALHEGEVDERGQTVGDGDRVGGTLLDVDHIGSYHDEAVRALFSDQSDDLTSGSRHALSLLAGLTGEGRCEAAYTQCRAGRLSPKMALGVLFQELSVQPSGLSSALWSLESPGRNRTVIQQS
ncbi:uncharacterized protein [Panulirus ornatus]|uniref:uncharacterized protein n=1 Tax=Panulirus ornatus TaxID=150431 RepID=UPI003A8B1654